MKNRMFEVNMCNIIHMVTTPHPAVRLHTLPYTQIYTHTHTHTHTHIHTHTHTHTPARCEDVYNTTGGVGEEDGPIEAEDHDDEEDRDGHTGDRFNGGHSLTH